MPNKIITLPNIINISQNLETDNEITIFSY